MAREWPLAAGGGGGVHSGALAVGAEGVLGLSQGSKGLRPDARLRTTWNSRGRSLDRGRLRSRLVQHSNQPRYADTTRGRSTLERRVRQREGNGAGANGSRLGAGAG